MKKVSEFSREHSIDRNTLTAYIRRHPELFHGHTQRKGRDIVLDDTAVMELEKAYHPQIVVSRPDPALLEAQEEIRRLLEKQVDIQIQMQALKDQLSSASRKLIEAEIQQKLLEDTQDKLKTAENDRNTALTELSDIKAQTAADKVEIGHLQAEIERLKHRNLLQRILNA